MPLTTQLVAYYKLDGSSTDTIGGNNGTDSSVSYVTAKINQGGSFTAASLSKITLPTGSYLGMGAAFSVSFWLQTTGTGGLMARGLFATLFHYAWTLTINASTGKLDVVLYPSDGTNTGSSTYSSNTVLNDGAWHHVVVAFAGGTTFAIYVDGKRDYYTTPTQTAVVNASSFNSYIGYDGNVQFNNSTHHITAIIDEVGFWTRALSDGDVYSLYNGGAGLAYPLTVASSVHVYRTVAGVKTDISSSVVWSSINLSLVLTKEVSTLTFDILKTPSTTIPAIGDQIDLFDASGDIFAGTVTETELIIDGGIQARYRIIATDWSYKFDAKNVAKTYTNMDPGAIVADIVSNFTTGFTSVNTALAGYTIPSIKFNYQPPTKCIQKIAQLIGWDWYIDPSKDVHFFLSDNSAAPFNLDDTSGNLEWPTIDYTKNAQNLKNSVFVIGSTYKKAYTSTTAIDVYKSVSGQQTYPLVYPYEESSLTLTVDGVTKTVGKYGIDSSGSFDALYSNAKGSPPFIVFSSDPGAAHTIKVFGNAEVPILGYSNDANSIASYGEFQDTIVDKQITTYQEAQQRALAEVIQYGTPIDDLKFSTLKTGLMIGQSITLNSTLLGINITVTITRIQATGYSPSQLAYQVEAVGGDKIHFTDLMAVLLEQELNQNSVDDTTVLQVLLRVVDSITASDSTPTVSTTTGPYTWDGATSKWGFFDWS